LGVHESAHWAAIVLTMFVSLAVVFFAAMRRNAWLVAALAIGVSSIALMTLHPPLWTLVALHAILFAEIFVVAWISERHVLAVLAIPFLVAMIITAYSPATTLLAIAAIPYLLFVAYPLVLGARAKASLAPYVAAALATLVVFAVAWRAYAGWFALAATLLTGLLLLRAMRLEPRGPRLTFLLALTLGLSDVPAGPPLLQSVVSVPCWFGLCFMFNLRYPNYFHSSNGLTVFDFTSSQPAENVAYTVVWAVIATGLLILGYLIHWPAARGGAIALRI